LTKQGTGIGVEMLERKHSLVKNNIAGNIDSTSGNFETLDTLIARAVP
jgi:hypothetical protein